MGEAGGEGLGLRDFGDLGDFFMMGLVVGDAEGDVEGGGTARKFPIVANCPEWRLRNLALSLAERAEPSSVNGVSRIRDPLHLAMVSDW